MLSHLVTSDRDEAPSAKICAFISYSRTDIAFARRLAAALEALGIQIQIDERDLPVLEDWKRGLLDFIRAADTVVSIVSPRSIASPVCECRPTLHKRAAQ